MNVSTRAQVGSSGEELIAGFVLKGSGRQTAAQAGRGPELRRHGVSGALDDPVMTAFRGNVAVSTNDDWSNGAFTNQIGTAAGVVGAFEFFSQTKDAALLSLLKPANYTVVVSSRSAVTGIAVVEVHAVPQSLNWRGGCGSEVSAIQMPLTRRIEPPAAPLGARPVRHDYLSTRYPQIVALRVPSPPTPRRIMISCVLPSTLSMRILNGRFPIR